MIQNPNGDERTIKNDIMDPFVVHERGDWVFMLLHNMCLPANLVTTPAHYPSNMKGKKNDIMRSNRA